MTNSDGNTAKDGFILASSVTRKSASNLWFVGQALRLEKRRAFEASYATMRVIDDFVDDQFLPQSRPERAAFRDDALMTLANWRADAVKAVDGQLSFVSDDDRFSMLFYALSATVGVSDLDAGPWEALARAMQFDIEERPLEAWADFEAYCTGATVAPAAVFLYVLQSTVSSSGNLWAGLASDHLMAQARDMAVFCYLVHILRDFGKDAIRGGQLLTIPEEAFITHGMERRAVENDPEMAIPLLRDLVDMAGRRRQKARLMADEMLPRLDGVEARILDSLLTIYERIHDDLIVDPAPNRDRSGLVSKLRSSLSEKLGLEPA